VPHGLRTRRHLAVHSAILAIAGVHAAAAATPWLPPLVVAGQSTVVWQHLPDFNSPYAGQHSLRPGPEDAVSDSYTLYTGMRLAPWLDAYVDTEMIRGNGIGGGFGLAGYTNGEVIRNPQAGQNPYLARGFLRATIPLGDETEATEPDLLQVGGVQPARRLVLTGGVLSTADIFDTNRYANNTRTQFLNWSFINDTAWDFAADTRGYTRGAAAEWIDPGWAVRLGAFQMPAQANGLDLDGDLLHSHGLQLEIELHPTLLSGRPMIVRAMAYQNHARMGNYRDAIALAARTGGPPEITQTEHSNATKYGFTLNVEQPLTRDGETGLFARLGWNDGATETFAFTEADRALSIGAQVGGRLWKRTSDRIGIAVAANGLSDAHADYLAAGGIGFELGDGRLSYRPETIVEWYYLAQLLPWAALTVDYQFIADPGDNAARGPVSVVSLRFHMQGLVANGGAT
jgi:high affinity Mn2+ porin